MNTLKQILEDASQLPEEQQEMLIKILQQCHQGNRRENIARGAQQSLDDFRLGKLSPQSAREIISDLRQSSDETNV